MKVKSQYRGTPVYLVRDVDTDGFVTPCYGIVYPMSKLDTSESSVLMLSNGVWDSSTCGVQIFDPNYAKFLGVNLRPGQWQKGRLVFTPVKSEATLVNLRGRQLRVFRHITNCDYNVSREAGVTLESYCWESFELVTGIVIEDNIDTWRLTEGLRKEDTKVIREALKNSVVGVFDWKPLGKVHTGTEGSKMRLKWAKPRKKGGRAVKKA